VLTSQDRHRAHLSPIMNIKQFQSDTQYTVSIDLRPKSGKRKEVRTPKNRPVTRKSVDTLADKIGITDSDLKLVRRLIQPRRVS
jgi:hypothetical protein